MDYIRGSELLSCDLTLNSGRYYVLVDKVLFGVTVDPCPDRWGRFFNE